MHLLRRRLLSTRALRRRRVRSQAAFLGAMFTLVALVILPGGASACACGEFNGVVAARGHSPHGVSWRIKATRLGPGPEGHRLLLEIRIGRSPDPLGYSDLPLPFSQRFGFNVEGERNSDKYSENVLYGVASSGTAELQVKMSDNDVVALKPTQAPSSIRQRFPWLKGMRFFAIFFPTVESPKLVTAFDHKGHIIGRSKNKFRHSYLFWS